MKELILVALEYAIIREGLKEFLEYARDNSRPVYIASDGFGFYIEPILTESGLIDYFQKIYCNKIVVEEKENVSILLPYGHRTCRICGNCKAYHVVNLKRMGYRVIYVGDGTNDRFGASHSDLVFARDRLANYLNEINTCFLYWNNFFDLLKVDEKHEIGSVLSSLCEPEGNGIIME
jgi:2-hydroxy-3-keto-5-methylthiopentenyl-1-phosphate phosphatase